MKTAVEIIVLTVIAITFIMASTQDIKTGEIYDRYAIIIAISSVPLLAIGTISWITILTGFGFGLLMFVFVLIVSHIRTNSFEKTTNPTEDNAGVGGGDIKLITACSLLIGGAYALLAYAAMTVAAAAYSLIKKQSQIRLAPFIAATFGAAIVLKILL